MTRGRIPIITNYAPTDLVHLKIDPYGGDPTSQAAPVSSFFGNIPVELGVDLHVFQNKPFSYAGKRIEIISPYTDADNEYQGQLHFHSTGSDGVDTPGAIVTAYRDAGYDFVSLTDHDVRTADPAVAGVLFIPGVEETADEGHIISTNPTAALADTPAQDIIDAIIADDAIPGMAHPNNPVDALKWTEEQLEGFGEYFAVEVYNDMAGGGANAEDKWDTLLSKHIRAFGNAVDDCHDLAGANFDKGWVNVFADSLTTADIVDALKRGNYYATTGPTISVTVSKKGITVTADSAATIAFIGNGGATLQTSASVTEASYTIVGNEVYVRIRVTRDSDSEIAWSNPIYVYLMSSTSVSMAGLVRGNAYIRGDATIDDDVVGGGSAQFANLGIASDPNDDAAINFEPTFTTPGTTQYGQRGVVTFDPTANNTEAPKGQLLLVYTDSAFDFTNMVIGSSGLIRHRGTGTIASATGIQAGFQLQNDTGGITEAMVLEALTPLWLDGNKTIATNYGCRIRNQGHANITTSYGLRIEAQSLSGTSYAIHTSGGRILLDQSVNDAAIPTIALDQADVSEGFINFIGSDRGVIGEGTNSTASVRVEIGGVVHRLALYADA